MYVGRFMALVFSKSEAPVRLLHPASTVWIFFSNACPIPMKIRNFANKKKNNENRFHIIIINLFLHDVGSGSPKDELVQRT